MDGWQTHIEESCVCFNLHFHSTLHLSVVFSVWFTQCGSSCSSSQCSYLCYDGLRWSKVTKLQIHWSYYISGTLWLGCQEQMFWSTYTHCSLLIGWHHFLSTKEMKTGSLLPFVKEISPWRKNTERLHTPRWKCKPVQASSSYCCELSCPSWSKCSYSCFL